jgi:cell division protein ZapA (FtsZ GTPase activity inhibitor)
MKQKYTLTIADMEVNVVTDESEEAVEYIVGMLDRKMREILLKSRRCTKNEAALLCALDFCADKVKTKELLDELESDLDAAESELKIVNEKLEHAESRMEKLERERVNLEIENSKLAALVEAMRADGQAVSEAQTDDEIAEATGEVEVDSVESVEPVAEPEIVVAADVVAEEKTAGKVERPTQSKRKHSRNRVGSMFDLLTFSDI